MKRVLCIWLPNWPLQRLAVACAELRPQAVVLYRRHAAHGPRVVSYVPVLAHAAAAPWLDAAQTCGIRPGMPLAEATALAGYTRGQAAADNPSRPQQRGRAYHRAASQSHHREAGNSNRRAPADAPPPHLELADPEADRVALIELAHWCQQFSPSVGLEDSPTPESLLLDVTGLEPIFGGEPALAAQVLRALRQRELTARVAIADTPGGAWAVTHFADLELLSGQACSAAAISQALGVPRIVPPGQTLAAVGPLSVAALRLPDETCTLLAELGLRRIEQIVALDRATLVARFGPALLEQLDRATGLAGETLLTHAAPAELEFDWPLEHSTDRREMIEFAMLQLLERACQALAREGRGMLRFECRFAYEHQPASTFAIGLYRASACPRHLADLARLKLASHRFAEPVAAVRLSVGAIDRLELRQQELFEPDRAESRAAPRELAALVDRLSNRLGPRAVVRPWLLAEAQPEFACQYQPLAAAQDRSQRRRGKPTEPRVPGDRPLYLEPRPVRLSVMSVAPEGPPMQVRLAGSDQRIVRFWGPERIETGWWRSRCVRRDYYQVETAEGERWWLFRDLDRGDWYLHGEFA